MAWDGTVTRRISAILPDTGGSIIIFECNHRQPSVHSMSALLRLREEVCVACSKPNWDRIAGAPTRTFDEVMEMLKRT